MRISRSFVALLVGGPLTLACGGLTEPGDAIEAGTSNPTAAPPLLDDVLLQ